MDEGAYPRVGIGPRDQCGRDHKVFNLFRRKPRFDDSAKHAFVEAVSFALEIQKAGSGDRPIEDANGRINRKAIGYIYGFIDAGLASIGQDMSDVSVGVPLTWRVLRQLFPGQEERYTQFLIDHMGKDEAVTLGAMNGGQQYIDFVVKRQPDTGIPMGLARYLGDGDDGADTGNLP
jgi:hypothetical protein